MIPMKNYLFQTPEDICVQLKKMTHPVTIRTTDIANFWHYLESATLPVITKSTTTENLGGYISVALRESTARRISSPESCYR